MFYILKAVDIVTTVLPAYLHWAKQKSCKETEKYTPFKGAAPERELRRNEPSVPPFSSVSFKTTFIC